MRTIEVKKAKQSPVVNTNKHQRNDPCPCGSGKKIKHCHILIEKPTT